MGKPDGIMWMIDEASRTSQGGEFIVGKKMQYIVERIFYLSKNTDTISGKKKTPFCVAASGNEFSVAHYTGKVTYDSSSMPENNRDFVPPEVRTLESDPKNFQSNYSDPTCRSPRPCVGRATTSSACCSPTCCPGRVTWCRARWTCPSQRRPRPKNREHVEPASGAPL